MDDRLRLLSPVKFRRRSVCPSVRPSVGNDRVFREKQLTRRSCRVCMMFGSVSSSPN